MATQQQVYETKILLNSEQAKKEITALENKVEDLKRKRQEALNAGDTKSWQKLNKEVEKHESKLKGMQGRLQNINKTLDNMSAAGPKQLKDTIKDINALLNSGAIERGSRQWDALNASLKQANTELAKIKNESKASQPVLSRFFKFLNDSWGGVVILFESITRLSASVRSSVEDYANMEEEMANVRKFTGLADEKVRDLNKDFKEMDTRTAREQINQLAGSAGRLGKHAKKDIMEFVEGADMINVALGEDLGEGAVEKIGKLAMAFGEDKKKGLKGAMLSTGSAINELVQNSSAKAGYLVDFTARVAGFGKQLGLTQAQIMGFGTVMDENLLHDEMAATAFGNMLTKMQTDTEKFAKIAGMSVKEFTDLLNKDANTAVLTLADSLKKADPQTMMKMLDSMGLDGSRAVGVLSTLADKIDDVRKHQDRATRAYAEATSVQKEFDTMNNTVQARIDKCKKKFKEMTVELGERLLPVVQYTISGGSALAKILSILTGFLYDNWKALIVLSAQVGILTVMWKAHATWLTIVDAKNKAAAISTEALTVAQTLLRSAGVALHATWALLTKGVQGYIVVMRAARLASLTNPWAALATVLTVVGVAIYSVTKAWGAHKRALQEQDPAWRAAKAHAKDMEEINERVNSETAKQIATVNRLTNIIRSNSYSIGERRKAIEKLQQLVPSYHASIDNEGKLIESNTGKLTAYINELKKAARAQAYMDKLAEIENQLLDADLKLSKKQNNLKAVDAELQRGERMGDKNPYKSNKQTFDLSSDQGRSDASVEVETNSLLISKLEERKKHEDAINKAEKERNVILKERNLIYNQMKKDNINVQTEQNSVNSNPVATNNPTVDFVTDEEKKKQEREHLKALREQSRQIKAEMDNRLAEEMLNYNVGLINYREYIDKRQQIQLEGIQQRKALFKVGSAEYLRLDAEEKQLLAKGDDEARKMKLKDYEKMHRDLLLQLEIDFQTEGSAIYHNEDALREARFQEEIDFLENRKSLTRKGSLEQMQLEWEIQDRMQEHKLNREREFTDRLMQYLQEAGKMNYDELMQIELKGAETMYGLLVSQGKMTKDEYDAIIEHIKRKYAELKGQQIVNNDIQAKAASALETAKKNANVKEYGAGEDAVTGVASIVNAVQNQKAINEQLKKLYGEDYENNKEYQEAKRQLDAETMQGIVGAAQAAYQTISQFMSAASGYAQACSDLEVARINANYDKQIEAAGKNSKKRQKLEKERDKKIAEAKTKANKKAMAIEIAQAVAQTAMGAINAYVTTLAGAPYPANLVLAPISAGIALAAGAVQIATIKKQHQAQEAGYYEGGFTGGKQYRKEAGVVHEGEFVANHQAVNNPNVLPFLNFLDQAQRNNTVGSLTAQDVSRSMGAGGNSQIVAPIVNVQADNEGMRESLDRSSEVSQELLTILKEEGIQLRFHMDSFDRSYKHFQILNKR